MLLTDTERTGHTYRQTDRRDQTHYQAALAGSKNLRVSVMHFTTIYSVNPFNASCSKLLLLEGSSAILV